MADIGKKIGMSNATVSMALRNNPRISPGTRALVKKTAEALGYRPDPLLSALAARKNRGRGRTFANLAVIIDDRWGDQPHGGEWVDLVLAGMRVSCALLGYELDVFYLEKDIGKLGDPDRFLHARGIRGLIISSFLEGALKLKLDWDRYAIVSVGAHPLTSAFHRIGTDFFVGMEIVCTELANRGYQRVGLAHSYQMESRHRFEWLGALSGEIHRRPQRLRPVPSHLPPVFSKESFIRWVEKHRPECVISTENESLSWLKEAGLRVPEEIGFASLSMSRSSGEIAGLITDYALIGDVSIMQLHGHLLRGELGTPIRQQETLICQTWTHWGTVRKIR